MTRVLNRQLHYVGNLGDVMKHAALVELSTWLTKSRADVSFVDTHAFQLHAPLADRARWERDVGALLHDHPAYESYVAREHDFLARTGKYRCSGGLVLDVLNVHDRRRACAILGEANAASRATIASQLAEERIANVVLVENVARENIASQVPAGGTLLVHVDPFRLTPEVWSVLAPAMSAMSARAAESVFILYRYSRNARAQWPAAPTGTTGPLIETRGGPHEVAAYASARLADRVREICSELGWKPH